MKKTKKSIIDHVTFAMSSTEKLMPAAQYVVNDGDILTKAESIADVNERDRDGRTMLMFAALNERIAVAEYLLSRKADINAADNMGFTALHFAVQSKNAAMVEKLLEAGADANARDAFGNSPLMRGDFATPIDVFEALLRHGAKPLQKNDHNVAAADMFAAREEVLTLFQKFI